MPGDGPGKVITVRDKRPRPGPPGDPGVEAIHLLEPLELTLKLFIAGVLFEKPPGTGNVLLPKQEYRLGNRHGDAVRLDQLLLSLLDLSGDGTRFPVPVGKLEHRPFHEPDQLPAPRAKGFRSGKKIPAALGNNLLEEPPDCLELGIGKDLRLLVETDRRTCNVFEIREGAYRLLPGHGFRPLGKVVAGSLGYLQYQGELLLDATEMPVQIDKPVIAEPEFLDVVLYPSYPVELLVEVLVPSRDIPFPGDEVPFVLFFRHTYMILTGSL